MKSWREWPIKKVVNLPQGLGKIKNPPNQLYYRGNWDENLFKNSLAVVGSRRMTSYGERVMERILPDLISAGITIISGFMYGVDTLAHQLTLQFKGKTAAVFACGLDEIIPPENEPLYSEILNSGGLVLSEYAKNVKARLWTFPLRNRIVAGLSQGVLVIEGGEKSGSLVTAKLAQEQGKTVMAVPGPVTGSQSYGTNWLIKNGAEMVVEAKDVLAKLSLHPRGVNFFHLGGVIGVEYKILQELAGEPMGVDDLAKKLGIDIVKLSEILSLMSIKGIVEEKLGKYNKVC
ncbi:MAG: DNA-processing protein DprA [Candidatus Beckwithbacteria bacterium]|nr:DNA-processing protein DprA [Candidatus Beckwithbacteria bacterium]